MSGRRVTSCSLQTACVAAVVLCQLLVGIVDCAPANSNSNMARAGHDAPPAPGHVPTFNTVQELCQWLCQRKSPHFEYGCPPSCEGALLGSWSKRATRGRRYDDFSFGFDDYLFMKLLGRDLGERSRR